jgi:hypothetical protein
LADTPVRVSRDGDGRVLVDYRRPPAVSDIEYALEFSDALGGWRSADPVLERVWPATAPADLVRHRVIDPAALPSAQFFRVKINRVQP